MLTLANLQEKKTMSDSEHVYRCNNCGWIGTADEVEEKDVDLEDEYGVGGDFGDHHHDTWDTCPECGSAEDLEDLGECPEFGPEEWADTLRQAKAVDKIMKTVKAYTKANYPDDQLLKAKLDQLEKEIIYLEGPFDA